MLSSSSIKKKNYNKNEENDEELDSFCNNKMAGGSPSLTISHKKISTFRIRFSFQI